MVVVPLAKFAMQGMFLMPVMIVMLDGVIMPKLLSYGCCLNACHDRRAGGGGHDSKNCHANYIVILIMVFMLGTIVKLVRTIMQMMVIVQVTYMLMMKFMLMVVVMPVMVTRSVKMSVISVGDPNTLNLDPDPFEYLNCNFIY